MQAEIITGEDGGYIVTIDDEELYVRQTLNEVGELLEDVLGEEADFDNIPEGDEEEYTYRNSPFGIIRTKIVPLPTKEDWDAQQAALKAKSDARKAKIAAEEAEAEAEELAEIEAMEKAAAAWQAKYPNKRRSKTKPIEDPGEGWEWIMDAGICHCIWTRTKIGR